MPSPTMDIKIDAIATISRRFYAGDYAMLTSELQNINLKGIDINISLFALICMVIIIDRNINWVKLQSIAILTDIKLNIDGVKD